MFDPSIHGGGDFSMTSAEATTNKLISLVIFITVFVALVPTVLVALTNISGSGIILATTVSAIGGILLGVFALKGTMKHLK